MGLRRWTPFTFLAPARYVDRGSYWTDFDLHEWADTDYAWAEDSWNGFLDFAKWPRDTVELGAGDCEDFALVAILWAVANDRDGIGIGFCWEKSRSLPTHVIAFDSEFVYSSGDICAKSPDEWISESRYTFAIHRRIT